MRQRQRAAIASVVDPSRAPVCVQPQDAVFDKSVLAADITPRAPVPEPASLLSLGIGLLGLAAARRRA